MKKVIFAALFGVVLCLQSCVKDKVTRTYTMFTPIYETKQQVYANIKANTPQQIQSPGKILLYGNYIFLNEVNKGIHVIDNSDPRKPVIKTFIDIPGNVDLAIKDNVLYADMFQDLLAIDISNPLTPKFLKDVPGVFPEVSYGGGFVADNTRIITGWTHKDTTVDVLPPSSNRVIYLYGLVPSANDNAAAPMQAQEGSMARFAVVNDYLFAVDHHNLRSVSIANAADPVPGNVMDAGWDIETIYPFQGKLFLGSMGGMFIYDISQPDNPVSDGNFIHATACDPVITDGSYAYITLRAGTTCGPANNELQVVNVQNLQSPALVKSYAMTNPFGLSKDNNELFICDGSDGLKVYDASDPSNLILEQHISGMQTFDAIAWNGDLIVVAKDGLYQYNYSQPGQLIRQSKLSVND